MIPPREKIEFKSKSKRKSDTEHEIAIETMKEGIVKGTGVNSFFSRSVKNTVVPVVSASLLEDQKLLLGKEEISEIKSLYLVPVSRKKVKRNQRKFVFDWNEEEDTSKNEEFTAPNIQHFVDTRKFDDRHWSAKLFFANLLRLEEMTERDWRIFKEDYSITVRGANIHPIRKWKESGLGGDILAAIRKIGYKDPTPIQRQAIPIAIANRDLIAIAETGSGKTASFVIPMLSFIKKLPALDVFNSHLGPYALVLAPTRELALQTEAECKKFAQDLGFICVSIVGGHKEGEQTMNLLRGAHIIIATPGRLVDFIERRVLALAQCTFVVLDEADRMVDLGFEEPLNIILQAMPSSNLKPDIDESDDCLINNSAIVYRQTVMFSATMPAAVERLAKVYLRRPVNVTVGQVGQVVDRIVQRVEFVAEEGRKLTRLQQIIKSREFQNPIIVFVNQKKTCDVVVRAMEKCGIRCATLHGGKSQDQREASLADLKSGQKEVLVATDVASRGLDIKNVSLVLNFDMAKSIEDYTHRIGRTGRAGQKGCAITFIGKWDNDVLYDLKILLQKSSVSSMPPELLRHEVHKTKKAAQKKQIPSTYK